MHANKKPGSQTVGLAFNKEGLLVLLKHPEFQQVP
ncbi:hypothetical protein PAHA111176_06310 [Parendozoicomonas haliclonae]|uniref:Uncharacterized protein n=1 Tax=Parendozoicomonas haliclonae TaxID=1960125 RepID=A0A1X7AL45_9GAMM|nr:hypothetical protein EHSB41UT_02625 [Parendozoicomonas haliclonae]